MPQTLDRIRHLTAQAGHSEDDLHLSECTLKLFWKLLERAWLTFWTERTSTIHADYSEMWRKALLGRFISSRRNGSSPTCMLILRGTMHNDLTCTHHTLSTFGYRALYYAYNSMIIENIDKLIFLQKKNDCHCDMKCIYVAAYLNDVI